MLRLAACLALLIPAVAFAAEPAQDACATLGDGDACSFKEPVKDDAGLSYRDVTGTCQSDECCEQDYSQGSPPKVSCGPCLTCKPGAAPTPDTKVGGSSPSEPPRAGEDPPASAGGGRGCSVGGDAPAGLLGLLLLGLGLRRRSGAKPIQPRS